MNNIPTSKSTTDQEMASTKEIQPNSVLRIFLPSLTTLTLIAYFVIALMMNGDFTPLVKRGFFCNDATIKYPFKKDTISTKLLLVIAFVIPGIVIKFCDRNLRKLTKDRPNVYIKMVRNTRPKERKISGDMEELDVEGEELIASPQPPARRRLVVNGADDDQEPLDPADSDVFTAVPLNNDEDNVAASSRLSLVIRKTFGDFQLFTFGVCTTMLFTGIGKITCGRLRPHFLQRCQPNVDCSSFTDESTYVEQFTCTNSQLTPRDMSYITTSWPSGHAAIMFFSMSYLIFYLNGVMSTMYKLNSSRYPRGYSPMMFYGVYVLMIALAGYIAGTRVSDYHHHVLDVLSGAIIGFSISILLTRSIPMKVCVSGN